MAPDRLRFDFTHYTPVTRAELDRVEDLVNTEVLEDMKVLTEEMARAEAEAKGAIAFFGASTGNESGWCMPANAPSSCAGDPCRAAGDDRAGRGHLRELIGSNLRRVEALTGTATLERLRSNEGRLAHAAKLLKSTPEDLGAAIERRLAELREVQDELRAARHGALAGRGRQPLPPGPRRHRRGPPGRPERRGRAAGAGAGRAFPAAESAPSSWVAPPKRAK